MAVKTTASDGNDQISLFKDYLAEAKFRIMLDDLVNASVRAALAGTSAEKFPPNTGEISGDDFAARLKSYEEAIKPLQEQAVLLGKWATPEQQPTLISMLERMTDNCPDGVSGNSLWLALRWYPVSLLMYSAGIAALSVENYTAFAAIHTKKIACHSRRDGPKLAEMTAPVVDAMVEVMRTGAWNCLPEYRQQPAPESEYLFKTLQPILNELLFLGGSYDQLFDRFEILRSLIYADLTDRGWAPVGRFGYKHCGRGSSGSPFVALRVEAEQKRDRWGPIAAGLFRGSYSRFEQTAAKFDGETLSKLNWY